MSTPAATSQRVLFLDLEGVMTRGMMAASLLMMFHYGRDAYYSKEATRYVERLVQDYGFKVVLITRHGVGDGADLQRRLTHAGIKPEWLYPKDPDAIPNGAQTKGDSVMAWLARHPEIDIRNTVAADDNPEQLTRFRVGDAGYPEDRIVPINGTHGIISPDFVNILKKVGAVFTLTTKPLPSPKNTRQ